MQGSDVSPRPSLWPRTIVAGLLILSAVLEARKAFHQFEWVALFCLGLYFLIAAPSKKGEPLGSWEPLGSFFNGPRAIASSILLMVAVIGLGYNLYILLTR